MYSLKDSVEFIEEVRGVDESLKNARLNSIEIDREAQKITYNFICDRMVSEEVRDRLLKVVSQMTLPAFTEVSVVVKKIVSNDELINNAIYRYLKDNFTSISIFLKPTDVISTCVGNTVKYVLRLTKDGVEYVNVNGTIRKLNEYLSKNFCADFAGSTEEKEVEETISLISEEVYATELKKIEHRSIKVEDVVVIDDDTIGDIATYIEDATSGEITLCGTITDIAERETKNGKPFFIIKIDDTTGKIGGVYFSKKGTLSRIKDLKVGDAIIARGSIGDYKGMQSLTYDKINRCTFPKDFVKKERYKNKAPAHYKLVFPEPASTIKMNSVFDDLEIPEELLNNTYVVFDIETTGLDLMNNGITEIGAVKIVKGKIVEQFQTLVKPDYAISEDNIAITGITPEMVKDSPKIGSVIPDFMKFIEGSIIVAHNAEFDCKFIKRFAGAEEYEVNNKVLDTMEMTRKYLPFLKRADLATLAEHFGIIFHHHRALSDAYATAEAFIELMKIKAKS